MADLIIFLALIVSTSIVAASDQDNSAILERLHKLERNFEEQRAENVALQEKLKTLDSIDERLAKVEELTKVVSLRTCDEYAK